MTGPAIFATNELFDLLFAVDRKLQAAANATGTAKVLTEALDFVAGILSDRADNGGDLVDQIFLKLVGFFVGCSGSSANFKRRVLVQSEIWSQCPSLAAAGNGEEAFRRLQMLWTRAAIEADVATCQQILSLCERLAAIFVKNPGIFGLLRDSLSWNAVHPITVAAFGTEAVLASLTMAKLLHHECIARLDSGLTVDTKLPRLADTLLFDPLLKFAALPAVDKETRFNAIKTLVILESFRPEKSGQLRDYINQEGGLFAISKGDQSMDYVAILSIK